MKKKFIRLAETDLHRIINESVKRILTERKAWVNPYQQYMQNYGDNGFNVFYDSDDDTQHWKTDVWRLNEMLKDMQKYCPRAASNIRAAISQIYKTMGTEGLQQSQPQQQVQPQQQAQQQRWAQNSTQPNMNYNYTQTSTQPNTNYNWYQTSTMPQYQQQPQQRQKQPGLFATLAKKMRPKAQSPFARRRQKQYQQQGARI